MPITATPVIGLQVVFDDKMFKIFEGDIVTDLVYQEGVVQKKVSGTPKRYCDRYLYVTGIQNLPAAFP